MIEQVVYLCQSSLEVVTQHRLELGQMSWMTLIAVAALKHTGLSPSLSS